MITGQVVAGREVVILLTLQGTQGQMTTLDAIVDTGFTGFLTLPLSQIAQLGFSYEGIIDARLGDGRAAEFDMFAGTVLWDGYVRTGTALAETLHQSMTAIWAEVAFTHPSFKQVALALSREGAATLGIV